MQKKKLLKFIMELKEFRSVWIETGLGIFSGLAFIYSVFALYFISSRVGIEMPNIINYSAKAFGMWLTGAILMFIVGIFLWTIYFNKRNWRKNEK